MEKPMRACRPLRLVIVDQPVDHRVRGGPAFNVLAADGQ